MKLVFMGTPDFAVPALAALATAGHTIAAVYTQPPRAAGRGLAARASPVHQAASAYGFPVLTPASFKSDANQADFIQLASDAAIVVAYGLLLPAPVLDAPRLGCFNIHASLLPRWRGAAPIQRAIMAGDSETGVSIMRMDRGLDTGPVCATAAIEIGETATAGELHDRLAVLGAHLMTDVLAQPHIDCQPQPAGGASYARKIDKTETRIDFRRSAREVRCHINGLSPFPGAWFRLDGQRIRALRAAPAEGAAPPGTILDTSLTIACGEGAVRLVEVQREGREPMTAAAFLRGFNAAPGSRAE